MKIIIEAEAKEIAALVLEIQERREDPREARDDIMAKRTPEIDQAVTSVGQKQPLLIGLEHAWEHIIKPPEISRDRRAEHPEPTKLPAAPCDN